MGTLEDHQEIDEKHDAEDHKGSDLKPEGKFRHGETFQRVWDIAISLSDPVAQDLPSPAKRHCLTC